MSVVSALNTALSRLAAAQPEMDTVGRNIANANTPGDSRQRVELSSIRDSFLESTRAAAVARMSALQAQSTALAGAERLLAEPSETGVQSALDAFYASWHRAATTPTDPSAGAVVVQQGAALANQLQSASRGLSTQWSSSHERLDGVVYQADQAASGLAALNAAILQGRSVDQPVNELVDQRNQLVRTLGELVGGTALPADDGTVSVTVSGIGVVSGGHAEQLRLGDGSSITDTANPPTLLWGNLFVPVESGAAAGLLAALRTDIPAISADVDGVAVTLRDAVNLLHNAGYTIDGSPGGDFFSGTGAGDLAVVPTAGGQIAVSAVPGDADGSNAQAIADLSLDANAASVLSPLGGGGGPSVRWREATSGLGVKVHGLSRATAVQESVVSVAAAAVEADAGVNLDEEMTNMLLWQRAYQAAARVITATDEMLEVVRASDDPSAATSAMTLRSQQAGTEQYLRNVDDANGRLGVSDNALSDISSQLRRARELMLQSGNISVNDSGRAAIAQELGGIRDAVIGHYNTRWLDRPVFGGTTSGGIAVEVGTGSYVGNDADIVTRVSQDATVRTDVKGSAVGADTLPDLLRQLAADVVGGSGTSTANLDTLDGEIDKVIAGLGDVGARGARVASARTILDARRLDLTARISEQEDADIPETIMQLSAQQTAYQSALRAASQVLQVSLVDFLRGHPDGCRRCTADDR